MDTALQNAKNPLLTIPEKKIEETLRIIADAFKTDNNGISKEGAVLLESVSRYLQSNIPIDYIFRDMDEFIGFPGLKTKYEEIAADIPKVYNKGYKYCFAGSFGLGKSMVLCCVLKKANDKGYSALYTTLSDIINTLVSKDQDNKTEARRILIETDFLAVDEFDPRYIGSENAAELYGRIIEPILRTRIQNRLPMFFCTNNPKPTAGFTGALKESISSLMSTVEIVPVLGKDQRGIKKNG